MPKLSEQFKAILRSFIRSDRQRIKDGDKKNYTDEERMTKIRRHQGYLDADKRER